MASSGDEDLIFMIQGAPQGREENFGTRHSPTREKRIGTRLAIKQERKGDFFSMKRL